MSEIFNVGVVSAGNVGLSTLRDKFAEFANNKKVPSETIVRFTCIDESWSYVFTPLGKYNEYLKNKLTRFNRIFVLYTPDSEIPEVPVEFKNVPTYYVMMKEDLYNPEKHKDIRKPNFSVSNTNDKSMVRAYNRMICFNNLYANV